jgi:serine/threonine-protein kinase
MGDVYVAKHSATRLIVALKCLRVRYQDNAAMASRMQREAQFLAKIRHRNIVAVFDVGVDDGTLWMAMELLEGQTLREKLRTEGRFSIVDALYIALEIAYGVMEAHEQFAIHRDLKPENVFFTTAREIKVLDFGVAKLYQHADFPSTDRATTLGTPHYMSPEHLRGEKVDARTDIYALGLILYEMLAGLHAFTIEGEVPTSDQVSQMQLHREPAPPRGLSASFPGYVWAITERALQKRREDRYASMTEMAEALHAAGRRALAEGKISVLFTGIESPTAPEEGSPGARGSAAAPPGSKAGVISETEPFSPISINGVPANESAPEPPSAHRYWRTRPRSAGRGEQATTGTAAIETIESEPVDRRPRVLPFRARELATEPLRPLAPETGSAEIEDLPTSPVGARPTGVPASPRPLALERLPRRVMLALVLGPLGSAAVTFAGMQALSSKGAQASRAPSAVEDLRAPALAEPPLCSPTPPTAAQPCAAPGASVAPMPSVTPEPSVAPEPSAAPVLIRPEVEVKAPRVRAPAVTPGSPGSGPKGSAKSNRIF